jgi:hypothetical protein
MFEFASMARAHLPLDVIYTIALLEISLAYVEIVL